jgi:CheY-like chemotaxis protein
MEEYPSVKTTGEKIFNSASRLMQTLNLILDLSKIESEETSLNRNQVDVVEAVNEIATKFRLMAEKKGLTLKFKTSLDKLQVVTDPRLLNHVVANLIDNALKFTHEGGIEISLELDIAGEKWFLLQVKDTGIGISEQDQQIIWDEFRQASEGWGRGYEGTGLGLSLTKKFIIKMGGEIRLESNPGTGSTFIVKLPYSEKFPVVETDIKKNGIIASKRKSGNIMDEKLPTILLIDDDEISLDVTVAFLREHYKIDTAKNVAEAMELIDKNLYSIILLDINLGKGITGFQILDALKTKPEYASVPVVAVTAYAMAGDREVFLEAGCVEYVSKPFTRGTLIKVCQQVTSVKQE